MAKGGFLAGVCAASLAVIAAAGVVLAVDGMEVFRASEPVTVAPPPVRVTVEQATLTDTIPATLAVEPAARQVVRTAGVVTRNGASRGTRIVSGSLLGVIAERPIFMLSSAVPMYRSLGKGAIGRDVEGVQQALRALGYRIDYAERSAVHYGSSTAEAVHQFYTDNDFDPVDAAGRPLGPQHRADAAGIPQREVVTSSVLPQVAQDECGTAGEVITAELCVLAGAPYRATLKVLGTGTERVTAGLAIRAAGRVIGRVGPAAPAAPEPGAPEAGPSSQPTPGQPGQEGSSNEDQGSRFAIQLSQAGALSPSDSGTVDVVVFELANAMVLDAVAIRGSSGQPWVALASGARHNITVVRCVAGRCAVGGLNRGTVVEVPAAGTEQAPR